MIDQHQYQMKAARSQSGRRKRRLAPVSRLTFALCIADLLALPALAQEPVQGTSEHSAYSASSRESRPGTCPGYTVCPVVDFQHVIRRNPDARAVQTGITKLEDQ